MDNAHLMAVVNGIYDALDSLPCLLFAEVVSTHYLFKQFTSLHELHHKAEVPWLVIKIDETHYVWMVNHLENLDFVENALEVLVRKMIFLNYFYCKPLTRLPVFHSLDRRERPAADRIFNFILFLYVRGKFLALHL